METWLTILLLMLLGFILLLIELFIIPGFGLTGISGLAALGYACYLAFKGPGAGWLGWITLLSTVAILIVFIVFLPRTRAGKMMRLNTSQESREGFQVHFPALEELVGKSGATLTMLRPSGAAKIEGKRVDVVTEGTFLPKNTQVKVVMVKGNRVVVRKV